MGNLRLALVFLTAVTACANDSEPLVATDSTGGVAGGTNAAAGSGGSSSVTSAASISCNSAGTIVDSQLKGAACAIVVRVNSDATQVLGYRVVCGDLAPKTTADFQAQLAATSSVDWSEAESYQTGCSCNWDCPCPSDIVLYVHAQDPYEGIVFDTRTGLTLVDFGILESTSKVFSDFAPGSDLSTDPVCPFWLGGSGGGFVGPGSGEAPVFDAISLLVTKGLFESRRKYLLPQSDNVPTANTHFVQANFSPPEYFVILTGVSGS
jgi:hypothetical protein